MACPLRTNSSGPINLPLKGRCRMVKLDSGNVLLKPSHRRQLATNLKRVTRLGERIGDFVIKITMRQCGRVCEVIASIHDSAGDFVCRSRQCDLASRIARTSPQHQLPPPRPAPHADAGHPRLNRLRKRSDRGAQHPLGETQAGQSVPAPPRLFSRAHSRTTTHSPSTAFVILSPHCYAFAPDPPESGPIAAEQLDTPLSSVGRAAHS